MPLFEFNCVCGYREEKILRFDDPNPACPNCEKELIKKMGSNIMIKMKGDGGYPSRRKQIFNTTFRKHPQIE